LSHIIILTAAMAESDPKSNKKIGMESAESRLAIGKAIDTILNIHFEEFQSHVSIMDFDSYPKLSECLSGLGQAMTDSRASFSDIVILTATMAESYPKRKKIGMESGESRLAIGKAIDTIFNIDFEEFQSHVSNMDFDSYTELLECLSGLGQTMTDSRASFSDIPVSAIVANMFHYLENRTDWNNFALVNKEINKAVKEHKDITPPWSERRLKHESIDNYSRPKFSPDGEFIAYGNRGGDICLWSRRKGLVAIWKGHEHNSSVTFPPSSNCLASYSDHSIKLWDLDIGNRCRRTQENTEFHGSVAFSPSGDVFATFGSSNEPTVFLWNASDGSISQTLRSEIQIKYKVVFSPDERTLAICGNANPIQLWNLDGSGTSATLLHAEPVCDIAYSPDGNFLASASNDNTIKIWDMTNQQCVRTFTDHPGTVRSVSFSPDGKWLASGSDNFTIRLWSIVSNANNSVEIKAVSSVRSVEFSKDGKMLLTKEGNRMISLRSMHILG
jgi:WD40 repeat protein